VFGNHEKYPKSVLEDNVPKGILVDMLDYVGKEMGCKFNIELYPWKRSYHMMLNGEGGIMGLSKTAERLETIDYSDVMYYDDLMLVVRKGEEFSYDSIEDLRGKRVAYNTGSSYGDEFERGLKEKIFEPYELSTDYSSKLRFLLIGRTDVVIIGPGLAGFNSAVRADETLLKDLDKLSVLETPFERDPNYLGFSKSLNMAEFIEEFNKALILGNAATNGDESAFEKIIKRYESANHP
jgi:ABC-type amino acid transport substrate-binding protein